MRTMNNSQKLSLRTCASLRELGMPESSMYPMPPKHSSASLTCGTTCARIDWSYRLERNVPASRCTPWARASLDEWVQFDTRKNDRIPANREKMKIYILFVWNSFSIPGVRGGRRHPGERVCKRERQPKILISFFREREICSLPTRLLSWDEVATGLIVVRRPHDVSSSRGQGWEYWKDRFFFGS